MFSRRDILEMIISGVTGGLTAGVVVTATRLGATADNFLNFSGGAVGAGLAVLGGRWLDRVKRAEHESMAKKQLNDLVSLIVLRCQTLPVAKDEEMWTEAISMEQTLMTLEKFINAGTIGDAMGRALLETHLYWIPKQRETLQKIQNLARGDTPDHSQARVLASKLADGVKNSWKGVLELPAFK